MSDEKAAEAKKLAEQDLSREEGEYNNGQKDGVWTYFDKKGLKEKEILFINGKERDRGKYLRK